MMALKLRPEVADLGDSYSLVGQMRSAPFGLDDVFTVFSPEALMLTVIKVLF